LGVRDFRATPAISPGFPGAQDVLQDESRVVDLGVPIDAATGKALGLEAGSAREGLRGGEPFVGMEVVFPRQEVVEDEPDADHPTGHVVGLVHRQEETEGADQVGGVG
jgi:hypothetical protein